MTRRRAAPTVPAVTRRRARGRRLARWRRRHRRGVRRRRVVDDARASFFGYPSGGFRRRRSAPLRRETHVHRRTPLRRGIQRRLLRRAGRFAARFVAQIRGRAPSLRRRREPTLFDVKRDVSERLVVDVVAVVPRPRLRPGLGKGLGLASQETSTRRFRRRGRRRFRLTERVSRADPFRRRRELGEGRAGRFANLNARRVPRDGRVRRVRTPEHCAPGRRARFGIRRRRRGGRRGRRRRGVSRRLKPRRRLRGKIEALRRTRGRPRPPRIHGVGVRVDVRVRIFRDVRRRVRLPVFPIRPFLRPLLAPLRESTLERTARPFVVVFVSPRHRIVVVSIVVVVFVARGVSPRRAVVVLLLRVARFPRVAVPFHRRRVIRLVRSSRARVLLLPLGVLLLGEASRQRRLLLGLSRARQRTTADELPFGPSRRR